MDWSAIVAQVFATVRRLPTWGQVVIICFALLVGGAIAYKKFTGSHGQPAPAPVQQSTSIVINTGSPAIQIPPDKPAQNAEQPVSAVRTNQSYIGGTQVSDKAANDLPQNHLADNAAREDGLATIYHYQTAKEDPPEQIIFVDGANKLTYKYFGSDKCFEVFRSEGDTQTHQWLKHPLYHRHDLELPKSAETRDAPATKAPRHEAKKSWSLSEDLLIPAAEAQSLEDHPERQQVQGACQNPHPGAFKYWWGPPFDQCQSPMYRQFGDGCTHYQIFNRCANVWDPRIFWTFCKPPPHF